MALLSIHSCVVRGHVGNSAAAFPVQCLGLDIWQVPTVLLSNHPGHGSFTGQAVAADRIDTLIDGLESTGALADCAGVLAGYFASAEQVGVTARAMDRVRSANGAVLLACDPVLGDDGKGLYVPEPVANAVRDKLIGRARIVTPNAFELGWLTGEATDTARALRHAAEQLRRQGPDMVLVTSLPGLTQSDRIGMMLVDGQGAHLVETPRLDIAVNGAGDMAAALFLAYLMRGLAGPEALRRMADTVYAVIERTAERGLNELAVLACREVYAAPPARFPVRELDTVA